MRGCQRKVIFLKNTGSDLFDEAYFIISREGEKEDVGEKNMIIEANRIIENNQKCDFDPRSSLRNKIYLTVSFVSGLIIGALTGVLLYLQVR